MLIRIQQRKQTVLQRRLVFTTFLSPLRTLYLRPSCQYFHVIHYHVSLWHVCTLCSQLFETNYTGLGPYQVGARHAGYDWYARDAEDRQQEALIPPTPSYSWKFTPRPPMNLCIQGMEQLHEVPPLGGKPSLYICLLPTGSQVLTPA